MRKTKYNIYNIKFNCIYFVLYITLHIFILFLLILLNTLYFKVAPKKELNENDKAAGEKNDTIVIEEKKEAPLATPEA